MQRRGAKVPSITVMLGSSRPGGVDIAFAGLARQTFRDFEVLFVDGRYHKRHAQVLDAAKEYGLSDRLIHVPNHRYSGTHWGNNCAGYNTGFALAAGEVLVFLLDYGYAPPDWLAHHWLHAGKLVLAPHEYHTLTGAISVDGQPLPTLDRQAIDAMSYEEAVRAVNTARERVDEISCFAEPFRPEHLERFPSEHVSIPLQYKTGKSPNEAHFFSTKNESFPRANLEQIGGMDEQYDRGRGPGDPDLGFRLMWTGLKPWVCREATVHCLNPRGPMPNVNIVIPDSGPSIDGRWGVQQGTDYYQHVKASFRLVPPNPIPLEQLRADIWHWRELSQRREACIPKRVIPDAEYYREAAA